MSIAPVLSIITSTSASRYSVHGGSPTVAIWMLLCMVGILIWGAYILSRSHSYWRTRIEREAEDRKIVIANVLLFFWCIAALVIAAKITA